MSKRTLGIFVGGANVPGYFGRGGKSAEFLKGIEQAEKMGIQSAWLVTGGAGLDGLTLFASAAVSTQRILFGTGIVPTFGRHPVVMAQQVQVIAQQAPGCLRLGIGSGHRDDQIQTFGADFRRPLGHVREYLRILKSLLQQGSVDFDGRFYQCHASIPSPVDVPVMISALQPKSFEVSGAESDGAVTWLTPAAYLRDVAIPSMKAGAENAGRPVPPLLDGMPVCVHDNPGEVRAAVREGVIHPKLPFYPRMGSAAGYPEAAHG